VHLKHSPLFPYSYLISKEILTCHPWEIKYQQWEKKCQIRALKVTNCFVAPRAAALGGKWRIDFQSFNQ
jgi:hypothetical protein